MSKNLILHQQSGLDKKSFPKNNQVSIIIHIITWFFFTRNNTFFYLIQIIFLNKNRIYSDRFWCDFSDTIIRIYKIAKLWKELENKNHLKNNFYTIYQNHDSLQIFCLPYIRGRHLWYGNFLIDNVIPLYLRRSSNDCIWKITSKPIGLYPIFIQKQIWS